MNRVTIDRIRRKTFPVARRGGYSKRAVHAFLDSVANWLETGEGDPARSDVMRRELARVGQRTAAILHEAQRAADRVLAEAEREAALIVQRAREDAERIRGGGAPPRHTPSTRERPERRAPSAGRTSRPGAI